MYVKIFEDIMFSSLAADYGTRHVFMDLLVLADREGLVDKSLESLHRLINYPHDLDSLRGHMDTLMSPDPQSKNEAEEGRRIIPIRPGCGDNCGYRVVNYQTYREIQNQAEKREANRIRKRRQRAKGSVSKPAEVPRTKQAAHELVAMAIAGGILTRPKFCEDCGDDSDSIAAHHDDYAKALEVRWLCCSCHKNWHNKNGTGINCLDESCKNVTQMSQNVTTSRGRGKGKGKVQKITEQAWQEMWAKLRPIYPKRYGGQRWNDAERFARREIQAGNVTLEALMEYTSIYYQHCLVSGKLGTDKTLQAATFFNSRYNEEYSIEPPPAEKQKPNAQSRLQNGAASQIASRQRRLQ